MFQFPQFPLPGLCVQPGVPRFYRGELPHSGIPGLAYLAANRGLSQPSYALLRLLAPRHPPRALSSFCTGTKQKLYSLFKVRLVALRQTKKVAARCHSKPLNGTHRPPNQLSGCSFNSLNLSRLLQSRYTNLPQLDRYYHISSMLSSQSLFQYKASLKD